MAEEQVSNLPQVIDKFDVDYAELVDAKTFFPITASQTITSIKRDKFSYPPITPEQLNQNKPPFLRHTLPDIYDINYVITLLKVILEQVEAQKFNPRDLQMTLNHSIKQLLGFLIVERDQQ